VIAGEACRTTFDEPAFEHAYRAYGPRLWAVANAVLHDRDAAQDAVHVALMRLLSGGTYRSTRGALLPFLIACVRREALGAVRAARRRQAREQRAIRDVPAAWDPTATIDPVESRRIRFALGALPDAQRDVVVRIYFGYRTLAEVAQETDAPLGTVKSRLSAALRVLNAALSEGHDDSP
jgi:RNA polymerase sigma-70 factor (ECF subfamily)